MAGRGLLETGKLYIQAVRRAGRDGLSMRLRLFGMLLLFLNAILMGFLLILFLTGTFHSGMQATRELLENELSYRAQNVYRSFGDISVQGVTLAGELSQSLEPSPPSWGRTRRCWRNCWGRSSPGCPGRWRRPAAAGCF